MGILFPLIILLFLVASGYVASKVCRALKYRSRAFRIAVWGVVLFLDFSFLLTRALPDSWHFFSSFFYVVSTWWLVVVLYSVIVLVVLDILRFIFKTGGHGDLLHTPRMLDIAFCITALVLVFAHYQAVSPSITNYSVSSDKIPQGQSFKVALVSDIHTGYAIGASEVDKLVSIINLAGVDATFICGDLIDGNLEPVIQGDLCRNLQNLVSPLGVFAVLGNHEYLDDSERAAAYLRSVPGLTLLRDSVAKAGPFTIIGRDDYSRSRIGLQPRQSLQQLLPDSAGFVIVLDHQPSGINEARDCQADLTMSGHTHAGQLWPMRIFTHMLYDLDYGMACYDNTTAVVTSGFGSWGPRARLGAKSEVVIISICGVGTPADSLSVLPLN